jgi:hypothetical protein
MTGPIRRKEQANQTHAEDELEADLRILGWDREQVGTDPLSPERMQPGQDEVIRQAC